MIVEELVGEPVRGGLTYCEEGMPGRAVLLLGPNPLLGGNLQNPVLLALKKGLLRGNALVLTLEYPAWHPAISEEEFSRLRKQFWSNDLLPDQMPQDVAEARAALDFLTEQNLPAALAGYSYGGALALYLAHPTGLPVLSISPPLRTLPPETALTSPESVLIRASDDLALTTDEKAEFEQRGPERFLREYLLETDDHFFLQELPQIEVVAGEWLTALSCR